MKLTEEQILENYQQLIDAINLYVIDADRKEKLLSLYDKLSDRIAIAPASSINTFHGAYAGGYVVHVLGVINATVAMYNLWADMGAYMNDYTFDELMFAAINHDLGKVGDLEYEYYIPNTSEWHVKNQGKVYVDNPEIMNMSIPDRSIWLLHSAGITLTQTEFLAIKLHDGPFVDENRGYFTAFQDHKKIRSNMIFILHFADFTSSRIEYEQESADRKNSVANRPKAYNSARKLSTDTASLSAANLFDSMFNTKKEKE